MAIRVRHNVLVQISGDTSAKDKRYYPETQDTIVDTMDRSSTKEIQVAGLASEVMNLHDIAAVKGMYLEVDGDIDLTIDGSATPVQLRKASTVTGTKARFFMEGAITSLTLDNTANATAVNGVLVLWGDPTP